MEFSASEFMFQNDMIYKKKVYIFSEQVFKNSIYGTDVLITTKLTRNELFFLCFLKRTNIHKRQSALLSKLIIFLKMDHLHQSKFDR